MVEHTRKDGWLHEGQRGVPAPRQDAGQSTPEETALVPLFGLVAGGQIRLRRVNGSRQIPAVLRQGRRPAA